MSPVLALVDVEVGGSDGGTGPEIVCVSVQQEKEAVVIKSGTMRTPSSP